MFGVLNLCLCIAHLASLFYTDYDEGVEAYSKGEYEKAVQLFIKAAEQGNADAQCHLGECYYEGNGVPQSYSEAVKWYRRAADQGCQDAKDALKRLGY